MLRFHLFGFSHCGIRGKVADQLAKRAIREGTDSDFKVPFFDLCSILKLHLSTSFDNYIEYSSQIIKEPTTSIIFIPGAANLGFTICISLAILSLLLTV